MTTALWIIAIVETIRMIEQSIQLKIIANDTGKRDNVYEELVKSFKASDREYVRNLLEAFDKQDEPQTNADQHVQRVEYVGNDEKSRCWTCKHFERMRETPISSDGSYYTYVVCTAKECNYEPKDEPQTDCAWK